MKTTPPGVYYLAGLLSIILISIGSAWSLRDELASSARMARELSDVMQTQVALLQRLTTQEAEAQQESQRLTAFILRQHPEIEGWYTLEQRLAALEHPGKP